MTKADGSFQKNHYDAEGLRAEMEENGQLVKFLYNENREAVAEEESDGNVIRYIRGLGLISSDSEKAKTYYHYVSDEQGSITHVINGEEKESGELPQEDVQSRVLNHYEYDAFGNTIRCEEQVHNRFRYTGEQYDPLTGQYYLRARYYNPVSARFTQEDTYYGDGLNLYAYCNSNPVMYSDPSGFAKETCKSKVGGECDSESGSDSVKNWKGQEVKVPDGHIMSPRDPSFSAKPITEAGPYTLAQRDAFLAGNSAGTKLAPHHRHQIPVRDGGVIDELPGPGHPSGNQHTAGSPSRHPAKSIFNSERSGNVLRVNEITQHWIDKGNRLIEVEPGVWIDPGF